ncbi:DUF1036 domain-containing protein [Anianabacter salinae]|uniref:DUF1036 domain-containing protein n=1 Tax=Anianabacter salinae TaxID=2851023 RepID=UPI00225E43D5|nr:DUF1036 domain-containing protein [Anianabacter salinae]MBV0910939.1 DUF1036 domain-containing protein [Anianabacter salinae]
MRCLALLPLLFAAPAHAALTVCNQTDATASVAIGYSEQDTWVSEGWWVMAAGDCKIVVGGDLPKRYYYWRATSDRYDWEDEDYYFCTTPTEFTIEGDTDCEARGHERHKFNEIDLGDLTDFTLNLTAAPSRQAIPRVSGPAPGTFGEPYSVSGLLSHCQVNDASMECEIHADGFRYLASSAGQTPLPLLEDMDSLGVNAPVTIEGDLIGYDDITAIVTIRDWSRRPADPYARLRAGLQGQWQSIDDDAFSTLIHGATLEDRYAGVPGATAIFDVGDTCEDALGAGPVLRVTYLDMTDQEPLCWVVIEVTQDYMEMHAVGAMEPFRMLRK